MKKMEHLVDVLTVIALDAVEFDKLVWLMHKNGATAEEIAFALDMTVEEVNELVEE